MKHAVSRRTATLGGVALAALIAVAAGQASADTKVTVGAPAPNFTATDSTGKPVRLSDLKGQVVVLEWTNHDCPFVQKHYGTGNMQAIQKDATQRGVVWLSVISSAPGEQGHVDAKQANDLTRSREAAPSHVLLDPKGEIGRLYGAQVTPHMYIVDKNGVLAYAGGIDDKPTSRAEDVKTAKNYVRGALDAVLTGGKVETPVTRAYGCTVKYTS